MASYKHIPLLFQFQHGAIKRLFRIATPGKMAEFQFQHGAIKSR